MKQGFLSNFGTWLSRLAAVSVLSVGVVPGNAVAQANPANGKILYENNNTCLNCHNSQQPADKAEQVFKSVATAFASRGWALTGGAVVYGDGSATNKGNPSLLADIETRQWKGMWRAGAYTSAELADMAAYLDAAYWGKSITTPVTPCTAQTLSWTVGTSVCSAAVAATAPNTAAVNVADTTAPTTGAATYSCSAAGVWSAATAATCVTAVAPVPCPSQTLSWTVGTSTCSAMATSAAGGSTGINIADTIAPVTGAATYSCSTAGAWSAPSAATCVTATPPPPCPAQTMNWTVGTSACTASVASTAAGTAAVNVVDNIAPATGAATYSCSAAGVWSAETAATCVTAVTPQPCPAQTMNWTVGSSSCSASIASTAIGTAAVNVVDNVAPSTGAATYSCSSAGIWSAASAATCVTAVTPTCPAQTLTWAVGTNSCSASVGSTAAGATGINLVDAIAPTTGAASFSCSSAGAWSAATGATCTTTAVLNPCAPKLLSWTVNGNLCEALSVTTNSGATLVATDVTGTATGGASFVCTNGTWGAATNASCVVPSTPSPCVATALSWTVGTSTCSASAVSTASGLTLNVIDTAAPTTGTATFSCTNGQWSEQAGSRCTQAPPAPRTVSSQNGKTLWTAFIGSGGGSCADCHGAAKPDVANNLLKINNAAGTAANQGDPGAIRRGILSVKTMAEFSIVSDADLADIAAYINATSFTKTLTDSAGNMAIKQWQLLLNSSPISSIVFPSVKVGSVPTLQMTFAVQAMPTAVLHVDQMLVDSPLFTLNRVPVTVAGTASAACPTGAFDLQPNEACGVELVLAVPGPGVVNANLQINSTVGTDVQKELIPIEASVTAEAKGGAGGGGCTLRSTPGAFDPVLWLLTLLSILILVCRRFWHSK